MILVWRHAGFSQAWEDLPDLSIPYQPVQTDEAPSYLINVGGAAKEPIAPHVREPLTGGSAEVAQANNRFAFDVFKELSLQTDPDEGMLFSPFSASAALSMTLAGAADATAEQMRTALGHGVHASALIHPGMGGLIGDLNQPREGYELRIANRLFGQQGMAFKEPFLDTMHEIYNAPLEELDFVQAPDDSRRYINGWVADQTNNRIKDLLPGGSVDQDTRLVLTNALYFDGKWKHEFQESATRDEAFHHPDGSQSVVSMMRQAEQFRYGDFNGYQMLEMPYAGDDLSMIVMLPDEADGLAALEASVDAASFESDVESLASRQAIVSLPKFRFEDNLSLAEPLSALGMHTAFTTAADFSGMSDEDLMVSGVLQKTFIEVDESGTEAAAATAVIARTTSVYVPHVPPVEFTVDHAFLYAIRDTHSGAILFLGRMTEPTLAEGSDSSQVPAPTVLLMLPFCTPLLSTRGRID